MKDYMRLWADELIAHRPREFKSKVSIVGERDQLSGRGGQLARVRLRVEPAGLFEIVDSVSSDEELRGLNLQQFGYPDWFIFGLLDVLMVLPSGPLNQMRVILEAVDYAPIKSYPAVFRLAGQDAGSKIAEAASHPSWAHLVAIMTTGLSCPVCNWELRRPAWYSGAPSGVVCASCGIHFGYDDCAAGDLMQRLEAWRSWRRKWIEAGMTWHSTERQAPNGWDPAIRLKQLESKPWW